VIITISCRTVQSAVPLHGLNLLKQGSIDQKKLNWNTEVAHDEPPYSLYTYIFTGHIAGICFFSYFQHSRRIKPHTFFMIYAKNLHDRKIPFEIVAPVDSFYLKKNINQIKKVDAQVKAGNVVMKSRRNWRPS